MNHEHQPGSGPDLSTDSPDPLGSLDALRHRHPVVWSDRHGWMVLGHDEAVRVLRDHHTFSNRVSQHRSVPNGLDPPEHRAYREMIDPFFDAGSMAAFEPRCRQLVVDLVRALPRETEVEVVSELGEELAVRVQTSFMGWPSHLHHRLREWARDNRRATRSGDRMEGGRVAEDFANVVAEMLESRRTGADEVADDRTAALLRARVDGRLMSDAEITSVIRNWTVGEVGTISAAVGIILHHLASSPVLRDGLRAGAVALSSAVDEMLRIDGPLMANRRVLTESVELGGHTLHRHDRLTIFWPSVNRDERRFGDPDHFDPDGNAAANLLYGTGIHVCPGAPLARMQLELLTRELLDGTTDIQPGTRPAVRGVYPAAGYESLWIRFH